MRGLGLIFKRFNRKAQAIGVLIIMLVLVFSFGMIAYFSYDVLSDITDQIAVSSPESEYLVNETAQLKAAYPGIMEGAVGLILVLFWLFAMIAGYYSDENPIMLVVFIIIGIIMLIVAGFLSNAWYDINADVSSLNSEFPITNFVLSNYMLVFGVVIFSALIMSLIKSRVFT
jgi:hypothetical protein